MRARTLQSLRVDDWVWIASTDDEAGMYTGPWSLVEHDEWVWRFEPQNCTDPLDRIEIRRDDETPIVALDEDGDELDGVFLFSWIRDPLGLES